MPARSVFGCLALALGAHAGLAQPADLHIDATDLPRGLLRGEITIDLSAQELDAGRLAVRYPQWVPGVHAPGGPIENVGGFEAHADGERTTWKRAGGDVYLIYIDVPSGAQEIMITTTYIANQPDANSRGIDSYGYAEIGFISPNTVLYMPARERIDEYDIETTLTLPQGWSAACSLGQTVSGDGVITLERATAETLVDTPIMVGEFMRTYDLTTTSPTGTPEHRMHVFSEVESQVDIDTRVLAGYRGMVEQAAHLFGSHPFGSYDVLLATSDDLGRNGLEHLKSSFNSIPLDTLDDPNNLTGWDRMLVPHEYVHAWCGKYRRPAGMLTTDFHTPKDTELLWVYEGLTHYLGEVLEVRSGMASVDEYRWDILERLRWAKLRQGRAWRPLADTTSASHLLRGGSQRWGDLRRGQDYYAEGALIWMEADAIIRRMSGGSKSLDDFCRVFFEAPGGDVRPKAFDRADVIETLEGVAPFDWDAFFDQRVDAVAPKAPLTLAQELGYSIQYTNEPPSGPDGQRINPLDARDSLGVSIRADGSISSVILGSAADRAGLAPDTRIMGINGYTWSRQRFADALADSAATGGLDLMVIENDKIETITVAYEDGPRFMTMVRDDTKRDVLADILMPR